MTKHIGSHLLPRKCSPFPDPNAKKNLVRGNFHQQPLPFRIALTHSFPFLIPSLRKPITDRFGSLLRIPFLSLFLPCGSPLRTVSDRSYAFLSFPYSFLAEAHYGPFRIALTHSFPFLIPSLRKPITDRFGSLLRIPFLSLFLPCGSPLRTVSDRSYAFLSFPYSFLAEAHYGPFRIALTHSFPFLIPSLRKPITDRFGSLLRIPCTRVKYSEVQ